MIEIPPGRIHTRRTLNKMSSSGMRNEVRVVGINSLSRYCEDSGLVISLYLPSLSRVDTMLQDQDLMSSVNMPSVKPVKTLNSLIPQPLFQSIVKYLTLTMIHFRINDRVHQTTLNQPACLNSSSISFVKTSQPASLNSLSESCVKASQTTSLNSTSVSYVETSQPASQNN